MSAAAARPTAEQVSEGVELSGRHAIVTGANTGLGLETTRVLALRGARVTMACRDLEKAKTARDKILTASGGRIAEDALPIRRLDLASLASVRASTSEILASGEPIHLLINNAGVMLPDRRLTLDGFEAHWGINHLGHFLWTTLLLDRIRESAPARIVNVSSDACHFASLTSDLEDINWDRRRFTTWRAYGDSKLMNVLFTNALDRRLEGSGVVSNALHPGMIHTELAREQGALMRGVGWLMAPFMKTVAHGAATAVYLATDAEAGRKGGGYFANCAPSKRRPRLSGKQLVEEKLWKLSEQLTG